uniref:Uncharacterized protein n=1 Tax=Romanomermis culicivorax TaxID=13658 RepID=A0A915JTP1_ROMCU
MTAEINEGAVNLLEKIDLDDFGDNVCCLLSIARESAKEKSAINAADIAESINAECQCGKMAKKLFGLIMTKVPQSYR